MVNAKAYELAASLSLHELDLAKFRPGTFTEPTSEKPLSDLKEFLKAWAVYRMLVRRAPPWDWSNEVVMDFAIEMSFFERTDVPYCGYYRLEGHPQFRAVADLVQAAHSSFISMLSIRPEMTTWDRIKAIHRQRCSEQPSAWSLTPPPCQAVQCRDTG